MHTSTIVRFLKGDKKPHAVEVILMLDTDTDVLKLLNWMYAEEKGIDDTIRYVFQWACIHNEDAAKQFIKDAGLTLQQIGSLASTYNAMPFIADMMKEHTGKAFDERILPTIQALINKYGADSICFRSAGDCFSSFTSEVENLLPLRLVVAEGMRKDNIPSVETEFIKSLHCIDHIKLLIDGDYSSKVLTGTLSPAVHNQILMSAFRGKTQRRIVKRLRESEITLTLDPGNTNSNFGEANYIFQLGVGVSWRLYTKADTKDAFTEDMKTQYAHHLALYFKELIAVNNISTLGMAENTYVNSTGRRRRYYEMEHLLTWGVEQGEMLEIKNKENVIEELNAFLGITTQNTEAVVTPEDVTPGKQ